MSAATPPPCPDRLHLIAGADIRAHIVTDNHDIVRAASRSVAGWTLRRPLAEVRVAAVTRGAAITALGDPAGDDDPVRLVPTQRVEVELVPA